MYTVSPIKNLSLKVIDTDRTTLSSTITASFQKDLFVKVVYICSGEGVLHFKDSRETIPGNGIVILNYGIEYLWEVTEAKPLEIIEVAIEGVELVQHMNNEVPLPYLKLLSPTQETVFLLQLIIKEHSTKNVGYEEISNRCAEIIFTQLLRQEAFSLRITRNKTDPEAIQTVKNYIQNHYQKRVVLDNLVKLVSVNKSLLIRIFTEEVGMSPMDYLIRTRIDKAKNMLLHTNMDITDIAKLTGFPSHSQFSKTFREIATLSPSQFRKQNSISFLQQREDI